MANISSVISKVVILILFIVNLSACQTQYGDTGEIASNDTYQNLRIFGDDLFCINHKMYQVERHNLKTGDIKVFSTGKLVEIQHAATDYDVFEGKVYVFSDREGLMDVFTWEGEYLETIQTPIPHHTSISVVGEDEFISVNAMYSASNWLKPRDATICKFNRKGLISKRNFPLPEPEKDISVAILQGPKRMGNDFVFSFSTIPSLMTMNEDISRIKLEDFDYPPLLEAFEKQMKVSNANTRVMRDYSAILGVEEISNERYLILHMYERNYKFVLSDNKGKVIAGSGVSIPKVGHWNRPFAVYKNGEEILVFYCLYKQKGIKYFKLKLPKTK